jgi:alpha-1,3-rhamnosyltransferase
MKKETPVTIGVTTFNCDTYINQTLNSIYNQSYIGIHLIVSDDCSKDKTLKVIDSWLKNASHFKRFKSIQLLTVPYNTGVSANCNRIIKAAPTNWIKFIAGDDILLPNCIEDNMAFAEANPDAQIVFSQVEIYRDIFEKGNYIKTTPAHFPDNLMHPAFKASDQWKLLLESDRIHYTPSYFFNKKAVLAVGGYDETNRLQEDYPMWLKLTQKGYRLHYFHKPTVGYRQHDSALNNTHGTELFKPLEIKAYYVRKQYAHPHLPFLRRKREDWAYTVKKLFQSAGWHTKSTPQKRQLLKLLEVYLNPWYYIDALQRKFSRK